jgi:hypothetical protein
MKEKRKIWISPPLQFGEDVEKPFSDIHKYRVHGKTLYLFLINIFLN